MSKITGVVEKVVDFKTSTGSTMYSLNVDGARYGTGSTKPNCNPGDTVSFDVIQKGQYLNVVPRSLVVETKASAADVVKATAAASKGTFNDPARQETISKQSALNSAIAFVAACVAADALPGVGAKATAEAKYDLIEGLVDRKMREFFAFSTGAPLPDVGAGKSPAAASNKDEWPE